MNGEEKEEAHRPRPLSGGIWTLFSWLRRSERSSSSDSLSSVGSARTAVSFDFLDPGRCNFENTPILTTQLSPPTETYKKRLQDRNLRRQRDRDITLHRKYGLFREYGNGYDGFSLPPARRALGNTLDRQNRERRATSESLQPRAAYVPGKRRAPLPPVLLSSASLPRSYKRKRPAPKPPVKSTIKEKIDQEIKLPEGMTSNLGSDGTLPRENEFKTSKTKKCDKKSAIPKDTNKNEKSKTDKSFLKHIFENRKRNSAIETSSLRLLPSISELDKQASEIIENNKTRQRSDNFSSDSTTQYEGNSWFCTSCLRKYNSSVNSCNYCLHEEKRPVTNVEKISIKNSYPRASIYTQTNRNEEIAPSTQSHMNEQKLLKEILKEMKDSLPKRNKETIKVNNVITETPTLRIGSTVPETYKVLTSQPSSSREIPTNDKDGENKINSETNSTNRILSISSLLSETRRDENPLQRNLGSSEQLTSSNRLIRNIIQHKIKLPSDSNIPSTTRKTSENNQEKALSNTEDDNLKTAKVILDKDINESQKIQEKCLAKWKENKSIKTIENVRVNYIDNSKNESNCQRQLFSPFLTKTSENNNVNGKLSSLIDRRDNFFKDYIHGKTTNNAQNQALTSSIVPSELGKKQLSPNGKNLTERLQNSPIDNSVVVNNSVVVGLTSQSNENIPETQKELPTKYAQNHSAQLSTTGMPTELSLQSNINATAKMKTAYNQSDNNATKSVETSSSLKPQCNVHIPLKISSLLNPIYSPKLPVIKEKKNMEENEVQTYSNADENDDIKKVAPQINITCSSVNASKRNNLIEMSPKEVVRIVELPDINKTTQGTFHEQKDLPSTSGCSNSVTVNSNSNHYDQRRHLIKQLEQSIATGDETAAADAAVKLAKLRLSCSVLSFSSQIVGESSKQNISEQNIPLADVPNTTSQAEPRCAVNIPQALIRKVKNEDIKNEITPKNENNNLLENKTDPEKSGIQLDLENESVNKQNNEPSTSTQAITDNLVPINVWVEDKQAARGPIRLRIPRHATIADLRRQAEHSLGLATQLQRWIIGHNLCNDDSATVDSLAGPNLKAPFYLCLVQSETTDTPEKENTNIEAQGKNNSQEKQNGDFYKELMKLEKQSLVPNLEPFECGVCMEECAAGAGVVLRECIHTFCRECLSDVVQHCQEPAVSCPAMGCSGFLQEREIRTIVSPEEHERWLARSLATAECGTRNTFHCRTRDCTGWAFCDPGVRRFPCPVCNHTNCVQCQAIHEGESCEQYQAKLRQAVTAAETNNHDEGTQALLTSLISRGEALECPECRAIITKKWGCDWVKCSACKTEICWITKGRRWGPGGRGDTSAGCRCGVDGQRCHPSCGYCH